MKGFASWLVFPSSCSRAANAPARSTAGSRAFAQALIRARGHEAREFSLRDLALPLYDGDLEAASGVPANARQLQQAISACDALLLVTPEYNGFPTPLVINAFDWLSRIQPGDGHPAGLATTADKPVGLLAASPGALGGLRSMSYLRQFLQMAFAMMVVPQQFALSRANEAFGDDGQIREARSTQAVERVVDALLRLAGALEVAQKPAG